MGYRRIVLISVLLVVMAGSTAAGLWLSSPRPAATAWGAAPPSVQAVMWPEPRPLAEFQLQTQHGEVVDREWLSRRWSLVFFGYLDCPDVCPTSLHAMREMRNRMIESGDPDPPRLVFVSVDPERDSRQALAEYLAWYESEFTGLHGPGEEIRQLADSMAVKYEHLVGDDGSRTIDHTGSLMVIDPAGRMVGALPPPLRPERMVEDFTRLRDYLDQG